MSDDADSLFDEPPLADPLPPPIPGLYFFPSLLVPHEIAYSLHQFCLAKYFRTGANQVMLFGEDMFPQPVLDLIPILSSILKPHLPPNVHELLFPTIPKLARQSILNFYHPGEGITPHVDLLGRYADGILGVSFGSSCTMRFQESEGESEPIHLFLPERSIIVLSGDARYKFTHGIERRTEDVVGDQDGGATTIARSSRMSITFRWLLPGADVVGGEE